jgi:hypothetical protein
MYASAPSSPSEMTALPAGTVIISKHPISARRPSFGSALKSDSGEMSGGSDSAIESYSFEASWMICVAFDRSAGPVRKELSGWKLSSCGSGGGGGVASSERRCDPEQNAPAISSRSGATSTPSIFRSPTAATASGRLPVSIARFTPSSRPSIAASVRPASARRRQVRISALGTEASCWTTAALQRNAASRSPASRRARARSSGESTVRTPGRTGGAMRMGSAVYYTGIVHFRMTWRRVGHVRPEREGDASSG